MTRPPTPPPTRTYPSKVDSWFVAIMAFAACAAIAGLIVAGVKESPMRAVQGGFILLGVVGFIVWLLRGTNYTLDERKLIIRSGPLRWTIALDDIKSIAKPANRFRGSSSPALSMDRLEIIYGAGKRLMISPENREQFLADLKARQ